MTTLVGFVTPPRHVDPAPHEVPRRLGNGRVPAVRTPASPGCRAGAHGTDAVVADTVLSSHPIAGPELPVIEGGCRTLGRLSPWTSR